MKISLTWLNELLSEPLELTVEELAKRLTMAGLEVEGIHEPIAKVVGLDDVVLEVNVTPNRPDALSHWGVARDLAALTGIGLKPPTLPAGIDTATDREGAGRVVRVVRVVIEAKDRCQRYAARLIEGVKVAPSPDWLTRRLQACGVRPINNLVDVTNYVLMELGQPLHAFDYDRLSEGRVVVRLAREGETLKTLDGREQVLSQDDLVIADAQRAQALAGVMGGETSEVNPGTTRVLLEAAAFSPPSVRRTAKRHGFHTEASHRFERGVDAAEGLVRALDRAAALIAELGGGKVKGGRWDAVATPLVPRSIALRFDRVGALLGCDVPPAETQRILTALGFTLTEPTAVGAKVTVPSYRVDIEGEADLVEEVARIRGYAAIPSELPPSRVPSAQLSSRERAEARMRQVLVGAGFDEAINYSFNDPRELEALGSRTLVRLRNPLTAESSAMRTHLSVGLLQCLARNLRHGASAVRLFEVGRVYRPEPAAANAKERITPVAQEQLRLGGLLHGSRFERVWTHASPGPGAKDASLDFYDAKGAVETVLEALGVAGVQFSPAEEAGYHPRATARLVAEDGAVLGQVGALDPRWAKRLELPAGVFLFELDAEALFALSARAQAATAYRPLPKYPAVTRDLAVVVPLEQPQEAVRQVILEVGQPLVGAAQLFDVYVGKPLPEGKKNLAFALEYRSPERTLTDEEVTRAHQEIVSQVNARLGAELR